jgi:caspase domain-containing protein
MAEGARVALVIGNSAYGSGSILKNPSNDARDIASAFTRIGFSGISADDSPGNPRVVGPMFDLDHRQLREAIAAFARAADGAEQAVMYYAGHGIEVGGQNYLVPINANLRKVTDVGFETVSLTELLNALEGSAGLKLIILDACRDNPFRNLFVKTRGLSRGLDRVEPSRDILVAYAAKHGTVALDGNGRNSPFATAFLDHVEEPGLEIRNFFGEIRDSVLEITGYQQEPFLYGTLGRRQEYLVPFVGREEDAVARDLWMTIKTSDDPSDYEGFVVEFPQSQFSPLAKRNSEKFVKAANDIAVLMRFKANYPSSPRISTVDQQIAKFAVSSTGLGVGAKYPDTRKEKDIGNQRTPIHLPTYEIVVGVVSAVLSGATYGIPILSLAFGTWNFSGGLSARGYGQIHTGIIFGVAVLVVMHHRGLTGAPKFVGLILSTLVLWIIYSSVALSVIAPVVVFWTWAPASLLTFFFGFGAAALLSVLTQWFCDRIIKLRPVILTALTGGIAGLALWLDFKMDLGGVPWFTFLIWEPTVLASLSLTMRDRLTQL